MRHFITTITFQSKVITLVVYTQKNISCDFTINTITVFITVDLQMHSILII